VKKITWKIGATLILFFLIINFTLFDLEFVARLINILLLSALLVSYRIVFGPSAADRLVGVDTFGVLIVGLLALLYVYTDSHFFIDIAIAWALQSFIVSLALAKYLEKRKLDD